MTNGATGGQDPAATVTFKSLDAGASQTGATNVSGVYRFSLLKPGHYTADLALAPVVSTESSINTPFTATEVAQLPSAGGDITNIAGTVPGVVLNNTMGYGNFSINGLPATSNLYTVNGENDMDPYFNINNSGAANLTLGQNEVQEATVIANPYSGQLAGAQVSLVTKSGTNQVVE